MSIPMMLFAASVSVSAFQGYHGDRPPRHDRDVSKATTSFLTSIETLLEAGNVDDAVFELRNQEKEGTDVAPSSYHAIIEACCAGGGGGSEKKRYKQQKGNAKGKNGRDRIELAVELLQSMNPSTPHAYEIVISGYGRRGRWSDANNLLQQMENITYSKSISKDGNDATSVHDCGPSLNVYQTVLTALAQGGQYDKVMSLLTKMRRRQVRPNVYTYNSLLNICAKDRTPRWKEALSLLSQCQREPGINPDLVTYTTAMRACAQARKSNKAMEIFRVINDMGMELDVYCYTTAMDACAKDRNWKTALKLLEDMTMRSTNMRINAITYNSAISALAKAARSESRQQRRFDYNKDDETDHAQNSDILWRRALDLIECMEKEGVKRDVFTYSAAISTCGAAAACGNCGQWDAAYELFNEMKLDGLQPDLVSYNALVGAGMTANKPDEVFDLWIEMCQQKSEGISPDIVTVTEVIATLDRSIGNANRARVDTVFAEAVSRGIILREDSLDSAWEFDLSGMSFPVARAACRFIFRRIAENVSNEEESVKDLSLITGASRMREYVREVLRDELKPAVYCVVPKMEQGTLQVKEPMVRNYVDGQSSANA
ncbi:predicted protein [Thalassiosira pseudonana CCMP1335]|uniref:Pentacotripeptide-repeat region of PRORP domain-containing protein n=1 Tax=Thalassiosira pseudonana TaxID=35128 RepID=B5YMN3_THAPS|nr:predicted protein [Thalassiosira pseudonana CCMP1335]ACI64491.1 predicted protein [Thalassiosira pseudonana CCMP1335]